MPDSPMTPEREKEIRDILKLPMPPFDSPVTSMINYYKSAMQELLNEVDRLRDQDKYFRQDSNATYWLNLNSKALQECDGLRQKLAVAVDALEEIMNFGKQAYKDGTPDSHSLHLGMCHGRASIALAKIRGEK